MNLKKLVTAFIAAPLVSFAAPTVASAMPVSPEHPGGTDWKLNPAPLLVPFDPILQEKIENDYSKNEEAWRKYMVCCFMAMQN